MADDLTATIPDPEMAKLEAMALEHDNQVTGELSAQEPEPAQPAAEEKKPDIEEQKQPDNSETDPEKKAERPRDELGRFTKTEDGKDIPENERKAPEPEKPETPYSKAQAERKQKEKERQDRSWEALNAEKDQVRQYAEQLKREAADLQRAREQRTTPAPGSNQQPKYTSADLLEAAGEFENLAEKAFETGDPEEFKKQLGLARTARQQAGQLQQLEQQAQAQTQQQQFQTVYAQVMDQTIKAEPDLLKPDSELSKGVAQLLKEEPVFSHIPDGFRKAVQVDKWRRDAGLVSELREKLTKAEAEVQRLTKATTPLGAGPTTPIQPKKLESLPLDEQIAELGRMAEQADREAYALA
jgi:hypothetical protein